MHTQSHKQWWIIIIGRRLCRPLIILSARRSARQHIDWMISSCLFYADGLVEPWWPFHSFGHGFGELLHLIKIRHRITAEHGGCPCFEIGRALIFHGDTCKVLGPKVCLGWLLLTAARIALRHTRIRHLMVKADQLQHFLLASLFIRSIYNLLLQLLLLKVDDLLPDMLVKLVNLRKENVELDLLRLWIRDLQELFQSQFEVRKLILDVEAAAVDQFLLHLLDEGLHFHNLLHGISINRITPRTVVLFLLFFHQGILFCRITHFSGILLQALEIQVVGAHHLWPQVAAMQSLVVVLSYLILTVHLFRNTHLLLNLALELQAFAQDAQLAAQLAHLLVAPPLIVIPQRPVVHRLLIMGIDFRLQYRVVVPDHWPRRAALKRIVILVDVLAVAALQITLQLLLRSHFCYEPLLVIQMPANIHLALGCIDAMMQKTVSKIKIIIDKLTWVRSASYCQSSSPARPPASLRTGCLGLSWQTSRDSTIS